MSHRSSSSLIRAALGVSVAVGISFAANAQVITGPSDEGRVKPLEKMTMPDRGTTAPHMVAPEEPLATPAPKEAKSIHFTLNAVEIKGMTAFAPEQMAEAYAEYLHQPVTLDVAWVIADRITAQYRNAGYFLSRAYVPEQHIKEGVITIGVVEGYIGKVELPDGAEVKDYRVVRAYINRVLAQKPITMDALESMLLRVNDLPGYHFQAVLSPLREKGGDEAAVKLSLTPSKKDGKGSVTFDNLSSRFLGPNEVSATYATSLLPLQQTTVSGLSSVMEDKLRYGIIAHTMTVAPDLTLELNGGVTKANPGYTLEPFEIDSLSTSLGASLNYQWVRQRRENLALKLALDGRDVRTNILHTPLTRDHIRALRLSATADRQDSWRGYNTASVTLSQGIDGLGASKKGELNLSRGDAVPDFRKAEMSLSRLQGITDDWSLLASASGQTASGTLYSSEQFGYGGQAFGRAYDASEITGDKGVGAALELRYGGLNVGEFIRPQPYAFYDIGRVWNSSAGQPKEASGSSAGAGVRFTTPWHQTGNIGLAWPLSRDIATPIYGASEQGPRILLQLGQEF